MGCRGLQGVTGGYRGYIGLQVVSRGYPELKGVIEFYKE